VINVYAVMILCKATDRFEGASLFTPDRKIALDHQQYLEYGRGIGACIRDAP
jgi:hypothetical protein